MAANVLADIIAQSLASTFAGIDKENVRTSLWNGVLELTNITLNKSTINNKLGAAVLRIPWKSPNTESCMLGLSGVTIDLVVDNSVPIETLWYERVQLIESIVESLRVYESLSVFSGLLTSLWRNFHVHVSDILLNISLGKDEVFTLTIAEFMMDKNTTPTGNVIANESHRSIRVMNLTLTASGRPIILVEESNEKLGIDIHCDIRYIESSVTIDVSIDSRFTIQFDTKSLSQLLMSVFQNQMQLEEFKRPVSSEVESLRKEYLHILTHPSPNWTLRRRFIELSVDPVTVAQWRRSISKGDAINVKDVVAGFIKKVNPTRSDYSSTLGSFLLGPVKCNLYVANCRVQLAETPQIFTSYSVEDASGSLVFPVGWNPNEFTGSFTVGTLAASRCNSDLTGNLRAFFAKSSDSQWEIDVRMGKMQLIIRENPYSIWQSYAFSVQGCDYSDCLTLLRHGSVSISPLLITMCYDSENYEMVVSHAKVLYSPKVQLELVVGEVAVSSSSPLRGSLSSITLCCIPGNIATIHLQGELNIPILTAVNNSHNGMNIHKFLRTINDLVRKDILPPKLQVVSPHFSINEWRVSNVNMTCRLVPDFLLSVVAPTPTFTPFVDARHPELQHSFTYPDADIIGIVQHLAKLVVECSISTVSASARLGDASWGMRLINCNLRNARVEINEMQNVIRLVGCEEELNSIVKEIVVDFVSLKLFHDGVSVVMNGQEIVDMEGMEVLGFNKLKLSKSIKIAYPSDQRSVDFLARVMQTLVAYAETFTTSNDAVQLILTDVSIDFSTGYLAAKVNIGMDIQLLMGGEIDRTRVVLLDGGHLTLNCLHAVNLTNEKTIIRFYPSLADSCRLVLKGTTCLTRIQGDGWYLNCESLEAYGALKLLIDLDQLHLGTSNSSVWAPAGFTLSGALVIHDPATVVWKSLDSHSIGTRIQSQLISVFCEWSSYVVQQLRITSSTLLFGIQVLSPFCGEWRPIIENSRWSLDVSYTPSRAHEHEWTLDVALSADHVRVLIDKDNLLSILDTQSIKGPKNCGCAFGILNLSNKLVKCRNGDMGVSIKPGLLCQSGDNIVLHTDPSEETELLNCLLQDDDDRVSQEEWLLVDISKRIEISLVQLDVRLQVTYVPRLHMRLAIFSNSKVLFNNSHRSLLVKFDEGDTTITGPVFPFDISTHLDNSSEDVPCLKTPSMDARKDQAVLLMHGYAVSVPQHVRFSVEPWPPLYHTSSSMLLVILPPKGRYGLCCPSIDKSHTYAMYIGVDLVSHPNSLTLVPCGFVINNMPCDIQVEVVLPDGHVYIDAMTLHGNSLRALYCLESSYIRFRLPCHPNGRLSDWSENVYFSNSSPGSQISITIPVVNRDNHGVLLKFWCIIDQSIKSIAIYHPFWFANSTDTVLETALSQEKNLITSVEIGKEGLWYMELAEAKRGMKAFLKSGGKLVEQAIPLPGGYLDLIGSVLPDAPLTIHTDEISIKHGTMETSSYTLVTALPGVLIHNRTKLFRLAVRFIANGNTVKCDPGDTCIFRKFQWLKDFSFFLKIDGESGWSRFSVPCDMEGSHALALRHKNSDDRKYILLNLVYQNVRGVKYIVVSDGSPMYRVTSFCSYLYSVLVVSPVDDPNNSLGFSTEADIPENTTSFGFEDLRKKQVGLIICFDELDKFKEVRLDLTHFGPDSPHPQKHTAEVVTLTRPILVTYQGYPAVRITAKRDSDISGGLIIEISPNDSSLSNWNGDAASSDCVPRPNVQTEVHCDFNGLEVRICDRLAIQAIKIDAFLGRERPNVYFLKKLTMDCMAVRSLNERNELLVGTLEHNRAVAVSLERLTLGSGKAQPMSLSGFRVNLSPLQISLSQRSIQVLDEVFTLLSGITNLDKSVDISDFMLRVGIPYNLVVKVHDVLENSKDVPWVEIRDWRISEMELRIWLSIDFDRTHFISPLAKSVLKVLSLSNSFVLNDAKISLPAERLFLHAWRGPVPQLKHILAGVYSESMIENATSLSVVTRSNILNLLGVGLFQTQRNKYIS